MKVLFRCFLLLVAAGCSAGFAWADDEFLFLNKETKPAVVERHPGSAFSSDSAEAIPPGKQNSAESILPGKPDSVEMPSCVQEPACCDGMCAAMQSCDRVWTIDYRVKTFFDSNTTYQFGVQEYLANPYAPLSKLSWPLDSTWDGLRIGVEKPNWRAHFEWLTPMVHDTYRDMADYDWSGPDRDPASLSSSPERWTDGQSIELEGSFKLLDHILQAPIELWPVIGFRFQRFDLMAHDGDQIINDGTLVPLPPPVGYHWTEDMISFNQQYYMAYIGGQLRRDFNVANCRPVTLVFQADWADTWGYNIDHHISGYEADGTHRYTMENTQGGAFHLALTAETPISCRFFLGLEAEHLEIRTWGSHHLVETGTQTDNETWTNGVMATSDQNSLTVYLRGRF